MSNLEKKSLVRSMIATACIIVVAIVVIVFAPDIRRGINNWRHDIQKADDATDYETLKKVEDTCRAYIASYEADKVTYETMKDSTDEVSIETARSAKIRANRTATTYNNYYLKNSYVWRDNVPVDIKTKLPIIE